jgi:hypothetical protein
LPVRWKARHDAIVARRQQFCRALRPIMRHRIIAAATAMMARAAPAIGAFAARRVNRHSYEGIG